ncbi:unnamed protein product [Spirodela intermedia]|uniref:Uncharacterized protein n=1 Tax=Spirodela intermedia TaxID=51605 RepID=A0A7I8JGV2_SPIIN|nr:unnamed protein product [Spirodela intermedia]CAA6669370.1 unnamed protein product [Spirodela intermedia]
MAEPLLTTLSMENNHQPFTLLGLDDGDREMMLPQRRPPDINLPLSGEPSPPPPPAWNLDLCDILDSGAGAGAVAGLQIYETESFLSIPRAASAARKMSKRVDSIWGAWFFFSFYFKPVLSEKSKAKITQDAGGGISGFDKSDLRNDVLLVQHDMENMYMWVFKDRPENALGKMQLRSYMNGHSRPGEPPFPFSADKGFVRSHRMQRKHYRGLSNPQCLHGIEIVRQPLLTAVSEADRKKWAALTGRELNFSVPPEASDFSSWRNLSAQEFELSSCSPCPKRLLDGSDLYLSTHRSPLCSKRRKEFLHHGLDEDGILPMNPCEDRVQVVPSWVNEFSGVMRHSYGPVTAAKTIYEDEEGYLILVSLPFSDLRRVKVSWKNAPTHGIVKILCASTARTPYIKRHDRTFKLSDPSPEHCPPGEFIREIPLATRIPEDAKLEAYYDETGTMLEIMVPKHRAGPEEHEVRVCLRPHRLGANE